MREIDWTQIPKELLPRRDGHGYAAGCECDLGFDPDCKIQPPYERTHEYIERLLGIIISRLSTRNRPEIVQADSETRMNTSDSGARRET